jgi:hypothetical protein
VTYTVTVTDSGQTSYTGLTVTDDLTGLLSEAAYNGDATATSGTVSYASPRLTWSPGTLAPGGQATLTYTVTVSNPETGGTSMTSTVSANVVGSTCPTGSASSACSVTTGIIAGPLSLTAPTSASLGSGAPGSTISGSLGQVQVSDRRGFGADWNAAVSSSDFTTGGGTTSETIPVGDLTYGIISLSGTSGPATFGHVSQVQLSKNPQGVVSATNVNGNTVITWNPVINVSVPAGAVGGTYTGTVTHSVS